MLFEALGDRVSQWLTINEAKVIAEQGYQYGRMAPGKSDLRASGTVIHHLNLAHGRAVAAFRGIKGIGRIGPCLQLAPCYPADDSPEAEAAAMAADTRENTLYLDPLLKGRYPNLSSINDRVAAGIEASNQGRRPCCHCRTGRLPWRQLLHARGDRRAGTTSPTPSHLLSGLAADLSAGPYDVLMRLRRDYASPEVLITENGVPDDPTDSSQPTADHARVDFLGRHLRALHQAIGEGCRVTGYHAWSLLDNFEWAAGYSQRWGLVQVDFSTP